MSERSSRLSRRHFLLAAGAGSAATAAAIVASKSTPASRSPGSKDKRATAGYAETDHVRDYYRTAKV
jgi:hypothetical protein